MQSRHRALGLLAVFLLSANSRAALADAFIPDDSYDFRGEHRLMFTGNTGPTIAIRVASDGDYRTFKFRLTTGYMVGSEWWVRKIKADFDGDGITDVEFGSTDNPGQPETEVVTFTYPEPTSGLPSYTPTFTLQLRD